MGKPDLDAVDETIACSLENCEVIVIGGVRNNIVDDMGHGRKEWGCHEEQWQADLSQRKRQERGREVEREGR